MSQRQRLQQEQVAIQVQKLTPQQLMLANLVELPVAGFEERVKKELYENDALEEGRAMLRDTEDDAFDASNAEQEGVGYTEDDLIEENSTRETSISNDEISDSSYGDDLPVYVAHSAGRGRDTSLLGDSRSLIDDLMAQMSEYDLTEHEKVLLSYLIGSLNDDGFVDRDILSLVDELAYRHGVDTNEEELTRMLRVLQEFDPPGIGARNLRECLLIQIERELKGKTIDELPKITLLQLERRIVEKYHDPLVHNNIELLSSRLNVSMDRLNAALRGIRKLNPRPGRALSESDDDRSQTVIPDFIVETDSEGNVSLVLNDGYVPHLRVNKEYEQEYLANQERLQEMSPRERDAFLYRKQKVEAAQMFIDSVRQRRHTLYITMKAIIDLQKDFFLTQDDTMLKPMILRDVATRTKLDESTISRVKNSKYAIVDGHVYSLDHFFVRVRTNANGEMVMAHEVMQALQEIVDAEDKSAPYSDEKLAELLEARGLDIKHRTVTKYRNQMGIPTARMRKEV